MESIMYSDVNLKPSTGARGNYIALERLKRVEISDWPNCCAVDKLLPLCVARIA